MDSDCRVTIPDGKLVGTKGKSLYSGITYYKFCGIPFAKPPLGALRFMPPKPPKNWTGVLDATKERPECIQFSLINSKVIGSEDCLYLNVYTLDPPRKVTKLKPVLVQIYGGGRFWGSSSADQSGCPDFFIDRDIVFVSFNFRLHILGFLNLDLPQCAGNMGLKDQRLALKWVKNNIRYFGGDPDNITVYGVSSGATDLHFHMMSPGSQDLFHKGIMQCGYALNPTWSYQTNHIERAFELAKELGYEKKNAQGFLNFLKRKDASALLMAFGTLKPKVMKGNEFRGDVCLFYPTVEAFEEEAFLRCSPRELANSPYPTKPLICSISSAEGLLAFLSNPFDTIKTNIERAIGEHLWTYQMSDEMLQTVCKEIKRFYLGEKEANESTVNEIIDMYSDIWYCEWHDWLDSISTNPVEAPVYLYYFDHDGPLNFNQRLFSKYVPGKKFEKASHGDDSGYFFLCKMHENASPSSLRIRKRDAKVINNMCTLFTNFIKNGDPNDENFENVHWTPHDVNNPSYLHLDEELKIIPGRLFEKRAIFWHNLIKRIKAHEKDGSNAIGS